jgi:hypothetical protein
MSRIRSTVYTKFNAVVQVLLEEVQQHIKQAGLEAIADLKGENIHIDFVENMLAVHKKYRDLIQVKERENKFFYK